MSKTRSISFRSPIEAPPVEPLNIGVGALRQLLEAAERGELLSYFFVAQLQNDEAAMACCIGRLGSFDVLLGAVEGLKVREVIRRGGEVEGDWKGGEELGDG